MIGQVEKIVDTKTGQGKKGLWTLKKVVIDGNYVAVFDASVEEGDYVAYKQDGEYEGKPQYKGNKASQAQIDEFATNIEQEVSVKANTKRTNTDDHIARQTCIKAAVELPSVTTAQEATAAAEIMIEWINS